MLTEEKPTYYCFHCGKELNHKINKNDKHHYCNHSCVAKALRAAKHKRHVRQNQLYVDPLKKLDSQDDILSGY